MTSEINTITASVRARPEASGRVKRPWGYYRSLLSGKNFQVKEIVVESQQRLSLQSHRQRSEHWVVVQGPAVITVDEEVQEYQTGAHVFIPRGARHRLANSGDQTITIIETQLGEYLGEDDIIRYQDDYQRADPATKQKPQNI